jgi:hypothetical protein
MASNQRTVVPEQRERSPAWSAAILLGVLAICYGLVAVYMARNHAWADRFLQSVPIPTTAASLAADPVLAGQIRIVSSRAWYTQLADRTTTLVAEAIVVNDALVPVNKVVVEASAQADGSSGRIESAVCGGTLSRRLLGRIAVDELETLQELVPTLDAIEPGQKLECQIAFPRMAQGAEEVVLRITWVEPLPGHPRPLVHPEG